MGAPRKQFWGKIGQNYRLVLLPLVWNILDPPLRPLKCAKILLPGEPWKLNATIMFVNTQLDYTAGININ